MKYQLKVDYPRQFIYRVNDVASFTNSLYMHSIWKQQGYNTHGDKLKNFFEFCNLYEIDPMNFILHPETYKLTQDRVYYNKIDLNSHGLHWKHYLNDCNLNLENTYNFKLFGNVLTYAHGGQDFLRYHYFDEEVLNCQDYKFYMNRKDEYRFRDYLAMKFYDFEIKLEKLENVNSLGDAQFHIHCDNGHAELVYQDFIYFVNENRVECPVCKTLVDNAFDDYMIQFYKHDGCIKPDAKSK